MGRMAGRLAAANAGQAQAGGETAAGVLELERFLPYRLSVLSNRISDSIAGVYSERFDIGVTEWRVIAVLGRFPGLSASEVAARTAMDKVAVSRAVARLLERGLLERETDDGDRRRSVMALSVAGRRVHAQVSPLALEIESRLLAGLDAGERRQLHALLEKLAQRVPDIGGD